MTGLKRNGKTTFLVRSLFILLIVFFSVNVITNDVNSVDEIDALIIIDSDDDFLSLGFPGNGTNEDPYIIKDLEINETKRYGIYITSTTVSFRVSKCSISNAFYGIYLINIAPNTTIIKNNYFKNLTYNLRIENADYCRIEDNIFHEQGSSYITVEDSPFTIFSNNSITSNYYFRISFRFSHHCIIENNKIASSSLNLDFYYGTFSKIHENSLNTSHSIELTIGFSSRMNFSSNLMAKGTNLDIYGSQFIEFNNNTIEGRGIPVSDIGFTDFATFIFKNNTLNGKPILILEDYNDYIIAENYSQIILILCSNVTISNKIFYKTYNGIYARSCTNLTIANCSFKNNDFGIEIIYSPFSIIKNITAVNCDYGIYVQSSLDPIIKNVTAINNGQGINVRDSNTPIVQYNFCSGCGTGINIYDCIDILISNNTCSDNYEGISVLSYLGYNSTIKENICMYNYKGIEVAYADKDTIISNNFCFGNKDGINLRSCVNTSVKNNVLSCNEQYGISIIHSQGCLIHHNSFLNNGNGLISQAYDMKHIEKGQNYWYEDESREGNFWSNWIGYGYYKIAGKSRYTDFYPMVPESEIDNDFDMLPDRWEDIVGLNSTYDDSFEDADEDGLLNYEEYKYRTNPLSNDTDSDRLSDFQEIFITFTDATMDDSDGDTLIDSDEIEIYLTDPNDKDSDDDGYTDNYELAYGTDPNNPYHYPGCPEPTTTNFSNLIFISILLVGISFYSHLHLKNRNN
ncbi:MAG: right-handed parallel beta-helix repeat-containing protein [Candidatus Heimdallarchaeota archaeon]|nr:right-handed parallel beta-helix repeat-containing protein [Candidatus Heimdallarchaeota archaeon]MCK4609686.1 right-handed parallel beta-helix repeat-containing protein [Candidatus Heimdallarchaeota archaeon]